MKLLLLALGIVLTNHQISERIDLFVDSGSWFGLLVFVCIWAASLVALAYVAWTPRRGERLFWGVVLGFSALLGEVYFQSVRSRLTLTALDQALGTAGLAAQDRLLNPNPDSPGLLAFVDFGVVWALLATGLLLAGIFMQRPRLRRPLPTYLGVLPFIPLAALAALVVYVNEGQGLETQAMPNPFYSASVILVFAVSEKPKQEKRPLTLVPVNEPAVRHLVLVIDESVSGDFIDLNRQRGTTPFLASISNETLNFGLATSMHNCSSETNALMRWGANPGQLGEPGQEVMNNPGIWQYARAAGFETTYLRGQVTTAIPQNFFYPAEAVGVDNTVRIPSSVARPYRDSAILTELSSILQRERPQFVLVIKQGVHVPYSNGHPLDEAPFQPAYIPGVNAKERTAFVNSYKNAIRWSVDEWFSDLFEQVSLQDFLLIYTSDHGQNLMDEGEMTHCRKHNVSLYESVVPLLAWTDNESVRGDMLQAAQHGFNRMSQFQVFPTLLDQMGYDRDEVRELYYQTMFEVADPPLGFISGPISGRFGAKPRWHSREGLESLNR